VRRAVIADWDWWSTNRMWWNDKKLFLVSGRKVPGSDRGFVCCLWEEFFLGGLCPLNSLPLPESDHKLCKYTATIPFHFLQLAWVPGRVWLPLQVCDVLTFVAKF
jgi:hypothetical protein